MGWVKKRPEADIYWQAVYGSLRLNKAILFRMAFVSLLPDLLAQMSFLCEVFIHHFPRVHPFVHNSL